MNSKKTKIKRFMELSVTKQLAFLESDNFCGWQRQEKIDFLKDILRVRLSPAVIAAALNLLRELKYRDKYFFRKYLYHIDCSVCNEARKAIREKNDTGDNDCARMMKVLREGDTSDRLLIADHFLGCNGEVDVDTLISFLHFNDVKVRDAIINKISEEHQLDESRVSHVLKSGVVWYVRAALVEILGKRKSSHLWDIVDDLMSDRNVEVKLKLVGALSRLREDKVKLYIQRLANDAVIWVRKEAQRALKTM
jgi:hypothetical protein